MRLDHLFPAQRLAQMGEYMKRFAASFGVEDFQQRDRIPNTRRALALAEVARDEHRLDAFRTRAMDAHWRDGMDLENDNDLRVIARDARLSSQAVELSKSNPSYLARVDAIREEANSAGVQGIPTFVIGKMGMSGCQPYDVFASFAERAAAKRR